MQKKIIVTKFVSGWLSLLLCLLLLAGCSSTTTPTTQPDNSQYPTLPSDNGLAATVKASPNKLILGISTPGLEQQDWNAVGGAPIAAEIFNRAGGVPFGGVNYYISFVSNADGSRPDGVAAAATQMISDADAVAQIGPSSAEALAPNLRLLADLASPMLLTLTSDTLLARTSQNPYMFYLRPLDRYQAGAVVDYLAANNLLKSGVKIGLVNQQNDAGQSGATQLKTALAAKGNFAPALEVKLDDFDGKLQAAHNQYIAQAKKLVEAAPPLILNWSNTDAAIELLTELHQLGWHGQFVTNTLNNQFVTQLKSEADGVLGPATWTPDQQDATSRQFVQLYQSFFHLTPDDQAAATFDAVHLLAAAYQQFGPDKARIRDWLAHLNGWTGLQGQYTAQPDGQLITNVTVAQAKNGKLIKVSP